MNLGRAIDQLRLRRIAIHPFQRQVLGIAPRAVQLDRRGNRLVQNIRDPDLGHGDLFLRAIPGIQLGRGLHGQQTSDLDIHRRITQHPLDAFMLGQCRAKILTGLHIVEAFLQRPLRHAQPAHAMGQPCHPQSDLDRLHALTHFHQAVRILDLQPVEFDLAMATVLLGTHDRNAPNDPPARLILVKEEGRQTAAFVIGCARQKNEMLRPLSPRDEPFAPVDHPLVVALYLGPGEHHGRVRARARSRFGHHDGRSDLAVDDGLQPLILLILASHTVEQDHVAVIRRRTVEGQRPEA